MRYINLHFTYLLTHLTPATQATYSVYLPKMDGGLGFGYIPRRFTCPQTVII